MNLNIFVTWWNPIWLIFFSIPLNFAAISSIQTNYRYEGGNIFDEFDVNMNLQRRYLNGSGLDEQYAMIEGSNTYGYIKDGNNNVMALVNQTTSQIEKSYTYPYE